MIIVESKRKKPSTLEKKYPGAMMVNVTSKATEGYQRLSPFYPHGAIPVPMSEGYTACCVEAIWQGLKVFESTDIDVSLFRNTTMKNIKRTVRKYGRPLGHRAGVGSDRLLGYIEARKVIYIPAYRWMLEHYCMDLIEQLRNAHQQGRTVLLLDYDTNADVENAKKALSHASLVRAYALGLYPYEDAIGAAQVAAQSSGQTRTSVEREPDLFADFFNNHQD